MPDLRVIDGIRKKKPDYRKLYGNALLNTVADADCPTGDLKDCDEESRIRMVLYGVKYIAKGRKDEKSDNYESLANKFNIISSIKELAGTLTPRQFQQIFPIRKDFDGEKWGSKDYFYTKDYIDSLGEDEVIDEKISEFLWEYWNDEVREFVVALMCVMSAIRQAEGGKSLAEEFFENQGLPTYTMTEAGKGKKFLTNNQTGETQQVKKSRPRYLKVIK